MSGVPSSFAHHGRRVSLVDVVIVLLAPYLALALRGVDVKAETAEALLPYWGIGAAFSLALLVHFRIGQILPHFLSRRDITQIMKMAAVASAFTAVAAFSIWRLELIPRSLPVLHFIVLVGLLSGTRAVAGAFERRRERQVRPGHHAPRVSMLIVGIGPAASLFVRLLKSLNDVRPHIVGFLDEDARLHGRSIDGHLVLGGLERFEAVVEELASHGVYLQRVVIAHLEPSAQDAAREALGEVCKRRGILLEAISERLGLPVFDGEAAEFNLQASFEGAKGRAQHYLAFRRYLDAAMAMVALLLLSPLICLVALAIRVRLGAPVTFWQQRVGLHGEPIVVHKFRTFAPAVDGEGRLLSEEERSSRLGRFLRASRLDELPQLYDVLRGAMSLIGPRPLLPVDLAEDCAIRLSVAPGLTGWAQIHGGKQITADEKNALDEWYVYHASLWLDLKIIWTTLRIVLRGDVRRDNAIEIALEFRAKRLRKEARLREAPAPVLQTLAPATPQDNVVALRPPQAQDQKPRIVSAP